MSFLLENKSKWSYLDFKGQEEFVDQWYLMSTPIPVVLIWVSYMLFVLKIGPELMKKRPPFNLNNVLVAYNAMQIVASCYIFYVGIRLLIPHGVIGFACNVRKDEVAWGIYAYFIAKVSELLDTIFFVLRKKDSQITFLHVYHHSVMMWTSWFTLKYEPTHSTVFLGTLNSFVHIIMYTYYGLSAFPDMAKYLWWKKYITKMQLIQFLLVLLQTSASYMYSECRPSYVILFTIYFNALLFFYLFTDFYIQAYLKNRSKKAQNQKDALNNTKYERQMDKTDAITNYVKKNLLNACAVKNFTETSDNNYQKIPEKCM